MPEETAPPLMGTVRYKKGKDFKKVLNDSLNVFFKDALRVVLKDPKQAYYFLKTVRQQQKAARIRNKLGREGINVPPILIYSITNRCNLNCKGCYNHALNRTSEDEMSEEKIRSVFDEAKQLGISFIAIAGGEPLVREDIIRITGDYPEILFLVFTNGLLITDDLLEKLKGQNNFVPVISLEGWEEDTDSRRGLGVFEHLKRVTSKVKEAGLFWSVSLTVTRTNFPTITDRQFIESFIDLGCKLFFFVEYTPIIEETQDWIITDEQRKELLEIRDELRKEFSALFIAVPGDEEEIGGCLSAGQGFVHINARGDVEPCPFAPYSDTNLRDSSLKDALQSDFLKSIRNNHEHLSETEGGCALWVEREWVRHMFNNRGE